MNERHVIKYTLKKNNLDNGLYVAKPVDLMTMSWENLLKQMQNNTALHKDDMNLAFRRCFTELASALSRGYIVETPLGIFRPTLKGTIYPDTVVFKPRYKYNDHKIDVNFKLNSEILDYIRHNAQVIKKADRSIPSPVIHRMKDAGSDKKQLSVSDILEIKGEHLKFDIQALDEGVFFIDSKGNSFRSAYYSCNTPKKVQAKVPEISPGEYHVKIVSRQGKGILTDDISRDIINIICVSS